MLTPICRRQLAQTARNVRSFSCTPVSASAAAAVKKLGVIGAGQMVIFTTPCRMQLCRRKADEV